MKAAGRPVLSAIRGGAYATHAAAKPKSDASPRITVAPQEAKVTRLPNGVVVASLENFSPLSRVSVLYHAGARHESADNLGVTHFLRAASNAGTQKATAFIIAKQLQQIGSNLSCTTSREHVSYTIDCLRSDLSTSIPLLNHVVTSPVFKPWEVDALRKRLKLDLELYHKNSDARLIEKLHRAAFRDTLGQSLYVHADSVGSVTPKMLEDFVGARYVSQGAAVVGTGVEHDHLVQLVRKMTFHQQPQQSALPETKKAKYHGGEARVHVKSPLVHAALVTEGVSLSSAEHIPLILLQLSLGVGPFVKYGSSVATSKVGKAALSAATDPCSANCINLSYSDSGLFGFHVVASAKDIRKVLTSVTSAMGQATKGSVTDAELQKAKKQLKSIVHAYNESSEHVLSSMGTEALLAGKVYPASAYDAALEKVTADDINKVAKKVINGKPTYAVVGDLTNTPYLDELMTRA